MKSKTQAGIEAHMAELRQKNFAIEVQRSRYHKSEIAVSVTHNGFQWSTISLLPNELDMLVFELTQYQKDNP